MTRRKKHPSQSPANQNELAYFQAQERFSPLFDPVEWQLVLNQLEQPTPQAVRLNPFKTLTFPDIKTMAERYGWQLKPVSFCPSGWQVLSAQVPPSRTVEHHMGYIYIQDSSSMLPAELFEFSRSSRPLILDMAASPGGKTTHLVDQTDDRGLVLANDASASRLPALRVVLSNWGTINTAVINFAGEHIGAWFPETFDAVLLDAPCSMESLHSAPSHPMRAISARERQALTNRQISLLASALQAVKVGGQVVYSTCTLAPEEDEAVLDQLITRYPGAFYITPQPSRFELAAPGLSSFQGHAYTPAVVNAFRIWPHHHGTAGFFAAHLIKQQTIPVTVKLPPIRPWEKTGLVRLPQSRTSALVGELQQAFGFNLASLLEGNSLGLWLRQNQVVAIPELYWTHFATLPCITAGIPVGEYIHDMFYISHELLGRLAGEVTEHQWLIPDELTAAWMRGDDLPAASPALGSSGSVICIKNKAGIYLGRGKILPGRIKNMLPRRLVQANFK